MSAASARFLVDRRGLNGLRSELLAPPRHHVTPPAVVAQGPRPWAGIGLCAGHSLTRGLPLDTLALLLALEHTRRALGVHTATLVLGDLNACAIGLPRHAVEAHATWTEARLVWIAQRLTLPLVVRRGSDLAGWAEAARVAESNQHLGAYEVHQLAQMRSMARRGARVKVGWRMPGMARDESYFDALYRRCFGASVPLASVYAVGGRGLHPSRPRACPYVTATPDERILLRAGEDVRAKLDAARPAAPREVNGYQRLVRKVGRELGRLGSLPSGRYPEDTVQALLDEIPPERPPS